MKKLVKDTINQMIDNHKASLASKGIIINPRDESMMRMGAELGIIAVSIALTKTNFGILEDETEDSDEHKGIKYETKIS